MKPEQSHAPKVLPPQTYAPPSPLIASGLRIPLKERPKKIRPRLLRAWEAAFTPRLTRMEVPAELRAQLMAQVVELGESMLHAWEQPHRAYHHSGHLSQMLTDLDRLHAHRAQAGSTPLALILAAWFHDAVMRAHRVRMSAAASS